MTGPDLQELRGLFVDEAREYLQALNEGLLRLEAHPDEVEVLHTLFRAVHSLKGMAGTMGLTEMVDLSHTLESVLDAMRSGKRPPAGSGTEIFDLLFRSVTALEAMVQAVATGAAEVGSDTPHPANGELVAALHRVLEASPPFGSAQATPPIPATETMEANGQATAWHPQPQELQQIVARAAHQGPHARAVAVEVQLAEDCAFKGARAYTVLRALGGAGEIVATWPPRQLLEEERFDQRFVVAVVTEAPPEALEGVALGVTEVVGASARLLLAQESPAVAGDTPSPPAPGGASQVGPSPAPPVAPSGAGSASGSTSPFAVREASIRVETERLDTLVDLVGELVITSNHLQDAHARRRRPDDAQMSKLGRVTSDLQNAVMRLRMVPVGQVLSRFPRIVRDLARHAGKRVELTVEGEQTELDRHIVNELGDPLLHLVRNAVDHGIEAPEVRRQHGKPETGRLRLAARHEGDHVMIELEDDGAGISVERIREQAVARGRLSEEAARAASAEDLLQLIFEPGFSTARQVTEVSGRGVGMDAAKAAIEALGGRLAVQTASGRGTLCLIRLPLTLAIIRALLLDSGGQTYALPLESVQSIERIASREALETVKGRPVLRYRGQLVPLVPLAEKLGGHGREPVGGLAVVVASGRRRAAVAVDGVVGLQEVVIRSLGGYLNVPGVAGATILGSGQVALILDALWLV